MQKMRRIKQLFSAFLKLFFIFIVYIDRNKHPLVAQLVEQLSLTQRVDGFESLLGGTFCFVSVSFLNLLEISLILGRFFFILFENKIMLNEAVQKWVESGLLNGLDEEQSNELGKVFEELVEYLISLKKSDAVFGFIFPTIRRIYSKIDKVGKFSFIVNVVDLFWDLNDKYIIFREENKKYVEDAEYVSSSSIDVEAEFVRTYCEKYIEDLKKRGII